MMGLAKGRKGFIFLRIAVLTCIIFFLAYVGWGGAENDEEIAGAKGKSGTSTFDIEVGSVIAKGERQGGVCVFNESFGVGGEGTTGAVPVSVQWKIDPECQVVITEILSVDGPPPEIPRD